METALIMDNEATIMDSGPGSNDRLAIIAGYALTSLLYGLVCAFHFGDAAAFSLNGAPLQALTKLQPLTYLRAAVHCAAATLLARYILTSFMPVSDGPFMVYVLPACGTVCAYLTMRFAAAETLTIRATSTLSAAASFAGVGVNAALFASAALGTVALAGEGLLEEDEMPASTLPLLVSSPLVTLPLVVILPLAQLGFHMRHRRAGAAIDFIGASCAAYLGLSFAYVAIQLGLWPSSLVPPAVQLIISAGVLLLTLVMPLLLTAPTDTSLAGGTPDDVDDTIRAIDMRANALALPLVALLVPILLLSILTNLLHAALVRLVGACVAATPDAPDAPHASPVPLDEGGYLGDLLGYFGFLGGVGGEYYKKRREALASFVWGGNIGCPVVSCLDAKSVEALLNDTDVMKHAHPAVPLLRWPLHTSRMSLVPNFVLSGSFAVKRRAFYLSLVPTDPSDAAFVQAAAAMKEEMRRWATLDAEELAESPLADLVSLAITTFSGTLLLGTTLPTALLGQIFPLGLSVPVSPASGGSLSLFPSFLMPSFLKARSARKALHSHVRCAPRWPAIAAAADQVGLSHDDACDAVLVAVGFNAAGMSNSMLNALLLLPRFEDQSKKRLREDPIALRSFVWELLRFNGPMVGRVTSEASTTIHTSAGVEHCVKKGTFLFSALSECQKDPLVWPQPQVFAATRFESTLKGSNTTPTTNALPVLGFGVPLGKLGDDEYRQRSHCCAGSRINAPWLEAFVRPLVDGTIVYRLNKNAAAALDGKVLSTAPLEVSLGPETRKGGAVPLSDETPKVKGTAAFSAVIDNAVVDAMGGVKSATENVVSKQGAPVTPPPEAAIAAAMPPTASNVQPPTPRVRMFERCLPKGYLSVVDLAFQPVDERIVYPKKYMSASNEVFGLTLLTCWTVSLIWFPEQVFDHPARAVIGHFNPCMGWDYAPASYIAVVGCSINVYLLWRYAFLESYRTVLTDAANPHLTKTWVNSFAMWSVLSHAMSSNLWLLLWLIGPPGGANGNWWVHTGLFMLFAFTGMLQSVGNYLEVKHGPRSFVVTKAHTYFICTYAAATTYIALMYFLALLGRRIHVHCDANNTDEGWAACGERLRAASDANGSFFRLVDEDGRPSTLSTVLTQLADVVWMACMAMVGVYTPPDKPLLIETQLLEEDDDEREKVMLPQTELTA